MKQILLFSLLLFLVAVGLSAQDTAHPDAAHSDAAEEMQALLQTTAVTYAQAARIVLEASETAAIADPAEAFRFATERNWLPHKVSPQAQARLDHVALLLVHSFEVKGGLMYTITKAPLFAYRELVYRNIIQGRSDPHMNVSGDTLLFLIGGMLSQREEESGSEHQ